MEHLAQIGRNNVSGGKNTLLEDKEGTKTIKDVFLKPGEILHIKDNKMFHNISEIDAIDKSIPFDRFIIIINSRFDDLLQNKVLRKHFPDAKLLN